MIPSFQLIVTISYYLFVVIIIARYTAFVNRTLSTNLKGVYCAKSVEYNKNLRKPKLTEVIRGLRDLNPSAPFETYSLSRGAPSPLG